MDRYEIGDSVCGVIDHMPTMVKALRYAQAWQAGPHKDCQVTIYDRMAHYGRPHLWSAAGSLLAIRPFKAHS